MLYPATSQRSRTVLWAAALVLLLAAIGNRLSLSTCVGECCDVEVASCCATSDVATPTDGEDHGCCSCCETELTTHKDTTPPGETPGSPSGGCHPKCGLQIAIAIEMAPFAVSVPQPIPAPMLLAPALPGCQASLVRTVARTRPFDRGPPRTDQRTALRACVVLLI